MDFSTFQDNVNPPEVTRVLPSMEEMCTSPVPKNLPTQIPHNNNFTYDCPSPNDIFVHQSTPYVPPARSMPPIIHTPMILITLSKFSGYANEDGEKFISDFTAAMTLQGITADVSRVSAFSLYLSGPAFLWFESLPPSHKSSWSLLVNAFQDKYVSFSPNTRGSLIAEMEAFNNLKLGRSTVEDFYFNILKLGKKLRKSQLDLMTKFIDGLPHQLQFFVRAGRPTNIDDALQSARVGESVGYGTSNSTSPHNTDISHCNTASAPTRALQDQINNLATQVMSSTEMLKQPSHTQTQHHYSADNRDTCFKCHSPGHRQNACKWNGANVSLPGTKCQLCSQFGHVAADCALHSPSRGPVNDRGSGANGRE